MPIPNEQIGARLLDEKKRERGRATKVVRRERALVRLDVTAKDIELESFLGSLDESRPRVQQTGDAGGSYVFAWVSGYDDGPPIRVQGILRDSCPREP